MPESSRDRAAVVGPPVQQPLENVSSGRAVDDLAAALAGEVGLDHGALDCRGGETLVPEGDRQIAKRQQVACELTDGLRSRTLAPVELDRQTDHEPADAV